MDDVADKGNLEILVEGDKRPFNRYGVILVNPEKHPQVTAGDPNAGATAS